MKIVGGHDYYDSALAFGHDPTVVLVREKDRVIDREMARTIPGLWKRYFRDPEGAYEGPYRFVFFERAAIVGDKFYSGVHVSIYDAKKVAGRNREPWGEPLRMEDIWTLDQFNEFMTEYGLREPEPPRSRYRRYRVPVRWRRDDTPYEDFFRVERIPNELIDYMVRERISIFVCTGENWLVNPDCLKDIGFPKALDPYTLFQELDMWVSGVLGMAGNKMVTVSNETKIAKHDFDRFSFRKPKQKT